MLRGSNIRQMAGESTLFKAISPLSFLNVLKSLVYDTHVRFVAGECTQTLNLLPRRLLLAQGKDKSPWQQLQNVSNPAVKANHRPLIYVMHIKQHSLEARGLHALRRSCCHGGCYRQTANILRDSIHDKWTSNPAVNARFRPSVYHIINKNLQPRCQIIAMH